MSWGTISEGLAEAVRLILSLDPTVISITLRSIETAGFATFLASIIGIPLSLVLTMKNFPGRGTIKFLFNSLVGIPTVTLGLVLYMLLSRTGPLGHLKLLYSVQGMAIGQAMLILPISVTFIVSALESKMGEVNDLARTLGASETQVALAVLRESFNGVSLAIISSFNRAFAELGIATMLGANITDLTRVLTTAIALETNKGQFGLSFALSLILISVVLLMNYLIRVLQGGET
ncbi:ABC transporter permease [Candidatus Bathyarchaeota archaeon]|jgi:tungstate transport system permease protein|nr:ABC transporter permease [Candidatus Bathyarchaeota archaeon]MBT4319066.1 ABC transporter permease [Candidatus Bathyarchaeota archaeon]MBT4424358.1 ABC transporter permease [Candidatus Bathyarchaeota archaeon]MBT5642643.1 ABC transporter permease [Candidatus Bathyarchaeota archaeon]MBT7187815.1 ABC transporter permease [Candidatus Bathyarchaeota archaeon]